MGVLALCIIFWAYWLIASYFLSRLLHVRWSVVAENAIIGALPLSLLPAHALFWWKVRQGGNVVLECMPSTLVYLFWSAIAVALLALSYKSLGSLARSKTVMEQGITEMVSLYSYTFTALRARLQPKYSSPFGPFPRGRAVVSWLRDSSWASALQRCGICSWLLARPWDCPHRFSVIR
jgi:hypothetical protein